MEPSFPTKSLIGRTATLSNPRAFQHRNGRSESKITDSKIADSTFKNYTSLIFFLLS